MIPLQSVLQRENNKVFYIITVLKSVENVTHYSCLFFTDVIDIVAF